MALTASGSKAAGGRARALFGSGPQSIEESDKPFEPITGLPVSPLSLVALALPASLGLYFAMLAIEARLVPDLALRHRDLFSLSHAILFAMFFAFLGAWGMHRNSARSMARVRAAEALALQSQLAQLEERRLAALGRVAAGFSHEIRNPLSVIAGAADLIEAHGAGGNLGIIRRSVDRINNVIRRLTELSGNALPSPADVEISAVINNVLALLDGGDSPRSAKVEVVVDPPDLRIRIADGIAEQIILPILRNANHATEGREGRIRVIAKAERDEIVIEVSDNGDGISPEELPHVFDPFFTTKCVSRGSGLGLSVVHSFVRACHGRIEIDRSDWGGALFRVILPATD